MSDSTPLPVSDSAAAELTSDAWYVHADALHATYKTGNMVRGGEFVGKVIDAAEAAGHHPDIDLRYPTVHLAVTTHSERRLTEKDVSLANDIARIAGDMNVEADPPLADG